MGNVIQRVTPEQRAVVDAIPQSLPTITDTEDYMNAQLVASQTPKQIDFNLRTETPDLTIARQIATGLKKTEAEMRAEEKMSQWRLQLKAVDSEEEMLKIAMEFDIKTLIEALQRNVEKVDKTYLAFCKGADKEPMHKEALKQIQLDMETEYKEIQPYLQIAENFKDVYEN